MSTPTALFIKGNKNQTVWSVDDAWFEGLSEDQTSIVLYEMGAFKDKAYQRPENRLFLKEASEYELSWDLVKSKIEERENHEQQIELLGDWEYFKLLHLHCGNYDLNLVACNFEYLRQAFHKINQSGSAVLLDIQYDRAPKEDFGAPVYGIDLMASLLKGRRNKADIFFVTGNSMVLPERINSKSKNKNWWVMRTLPNLSKAKIDTDEKYLEDEIIYFLEYFTQGNPFFLKDSIMTLWDALVKCHNDDFSHPSLLSDIPSDFLLRHSYQEWTYYHCESFKAIYDYARLNYHSGSTRALLVDIFKQHLEILKIKLNIIPASSGSQFRLPVQPGMLFIINLFHFLYRLNETEEHYIQLEIDNSGNRGKAAIKIDLDPAKNSRALEQAIITGGRNTIDAFRSLIACKELLSADNLNLSSYFIEGKLKDDALRHAETWRSAKAANGHAHIYKKIIGYEFDHDKPQLCLSWTYDKIKTEQDIF